MISLAGVPFTAGFLGKFFVFDAAIRQHQTLLVAIGVITVGCGFYYYLKVVRAMYWLEPAKPEPLPVGGLSRLTMSILIAAIFFLGVYPQPILNAIDQPAERAIISKPR
jgi:NADH-quinone oxidoreductase subunit N